MSSLLLPVVLESCNGGLRERRRSSIHSVVAVPRLFAASPLEGSAVSDEKDHYDSKRTSAHLSQVFVPPTLSALSHIQLPNNEKINYRSLPAIFVDDISTPSSSLPSTTLPSRKSSTATLSSPQLPVPQNPERLKWRLASAFWAYFLCGWGDGVTGTVLPRSTLGFMLGTILVESIMNGLGRFDPTKNAWSWVPQIHHFRHIPTRENPTRNVAFSPSQARMLSLLVSSVLHAMFFVVMGIAKGGFWVLFFAYALAAFARAILTGKKSRLSSPMNEYFAFSSPPSIGYAYGLWSFGGTISPLVCQSLLAIGIPWNHFYLGSLVLSAINTAFLFLTYRPTPAEALKDCEEGQRSFNKRRNSDESNSLDNSPKKLPACKSPSTANKNLTKGSKTLLLTIRQPFQWAICLFGFLYCGCETTTQALHANPKTAGYVTSGFWGGITIGRLFWGHYSSRLTPVRRKFVVLGCMCVGISMQILIWVVNSDVENAFSTSMIGLFYGPVFPASLALANDVLPSEIRMISMALISATSSIGASLFPFLAGLLSSADTIRIVPYITVPLAATIICLWVTFPAKTHASQK
ncbi:MFS general substrate transporter [Pholiota conissans]|uniref:MFS general substrate transporter n=1 Tax=Pholiota conissans TaxID=109636 RepID=A0A9P6CUF0_9AGAR|nr:MFS general substrate transporter [Pholiota conissans]